MHESERNRLEKIKRALVYAVHDMDQVVAACRALQRTTAERDATDDEILRAELGALERALQTAIVVCYARPFKRSKPGATGRDALTVPAEYGTGFPDDKGYLEQLHHELMDWRDRYFAHPDPGFAGRSARTETVWTDESVAAISWEEVFPVLRFVLTATEELAELQRARFRHDVAELHLELERDG